MYRPKIIIDITFRDGTHTRGMVAHSIDYDPNRYWELYVYMSETDIFKDNPRLYCGVDKVEVIGYLEKEEK